VAQGPRRLPTGPVRNEPPARQPSATKNPPAVISTKPSKAAAGSTHRPPRRGLPAIAELEEAGGAFIGGLRYGEGMLFTKNAGDLKVFWQGPTVGYDFGGDGARTMMLVYNLPSTPAIYQRFAGLSGSAYFIGGFGMTALTANDVVVVPIRSGVGFRLGANLGYLKFTPQSTWNPF
jgi:hypothetical protein